MVKSVPSRENEEQKNSRPETSLKPYQRTSFKKTRESSKGFEGFENDSVDFEIMFNLEEFLPELRKGLEEEQPAPKVMDPIVEAAADDGIDKFLSDNIDFMVDNIFSNVSFDGVDAATADSSSPSFEALMDNVIADYLTELFDNSNSNESDGVENREDVGELLEKCCFSLIPFFPYACVVSRWKGEFLGGLVLQRSKVWKLARHGGFLDQKLRRERTFLRLVWSSNSQMIPVHSQFSFSGEAPTC